MRDAALAILNMLLGTLVTLWLLRTGVSWVAILTTLAAMLAVATAWVLGRLR